MATIFHARCVVSLITLYSEACSWVSYSTVDLYRFWFSCARSSGSFFILVIFCVCGFFLGLFVYLFLALDNWNTHFCNTQEEFSIYKGKGGSTCNFPPKVNFKVFPHQWCQNSGSRCFPLSLRSFKFIHLDPKQLRYCQSSGGVLCILRTLCISILYSKKGTLTFLCGYKVVWESAFSFNLMHAVRVELLFVQK